VILLRSPFTVHGLERLEIRKQASEEFKALSGAAREAGVQDRMFPVT
jgi:DNA-damage-inducible protein D